MCSVFGAIGTNLDKNIVEKIREAAGDRGRNGGRMEQYHLSDRYIGYLGNWRATPTHEVANARLQPYDGVVHNGTIANDKKLGAQPGEVDSEVLPRILNTNNLHDFAHSLKQIIGSFAIACKTEDSIFAATNYKPIHYWSPDGIDVYFSSMERHFNGIVPFGVRPAVVEPYSCIDFRTKRTVILPRSEGAEPKALMLMSSGLDSTVAVADLLNKKYLVGLLFIKYGSRSENVEYKHVKQIAEFYNLPLHILTLNYDQMKGKSSIMSNIGNVARSEGMEFAHEWVPGRNLVMLANAVAFAEANSYHYISIGNNLEEAGSHPDNEEQFTYLFDKVLDYAVNLNYKLRLISPLGHLMKTEIVEKGLALKAPLHLSYSCYTGNEKHCGKCASCLFRMKAFERLGKQDLVEYE